jgi:DNA-binding MarR family transcriptional regulator
MSNSLLSLLHRANQIATEKFTTAMGDSDLTPRQAQVLAVIEANEGLSQTRIVELTGVDRSTLADLIKRLQKRKLIERKRDKDDARAYVVKISEAGRQALAVGKPAIAAVEKGLLPPKARAELSALLEKVITGQA